MLNFLLITSGLRVPGLQTLGNMDIKDPFDEPVRWPYILHDLVRLDTQHDFSMAFADDVAPEAPDYLTTDSQSHFPAFQEKDVPDSQ